MYRNKYKSPNHDIQLCASKHQFPNLNLVFLCVSNSTNKNHKNDGMRIRKNVIPPLSPLYIYIISFIHPQFPHIRKTVYISHRSIYEDILCIMDR